MQHKSSYKGSILPPSQVKMLWCWILWIHRKPREEMSHQADRGKIEGIAVVKRAVSQVTEKNY